MKRKHTVLAALWCLLNTKGYPQCVLRAVALGDDTDTIAAVAGPLVGLWYGSKQIPAVWELKTAKYEEIKEKTKQFYTVCMGMQHEESFY